MANNQTINVTYKFNADVAQAKQQMASLQTSLQQIMQLSTSSTQRFMLPEQLDKAKMAAASLSVSLKSAFNISTGKLDLTKFNTALKQANMTLPMIKQQLTSLGPTGQQAFMGLANAITNADTKVITLSTHMKRFATTMANTVRYQISASMFSAAISALSDAYQFAEDLNESLNNIRIVTGYGADEMDRFAEKANKAAKALNATTTEYTNASLIYFQQGLSMEEVEKRTAVTVKMAQVTGESMETVSDQLTAVWNNFYDGTKSLEYYADVITALGAATASSSDEITEGLEKFAAIADTVGLSYEYATAALATVTATTRQSADVVGTAFKTLFARIQDLELGKTLDDGTTLGKYSEALHVVGVEIKDLTTGELRGMDDILNDLASKWDHLGSAEKAALAQTVAGVRQYTQLIALMDNWDFMKENLATATGSEGALQEQADIYGESWEAARDRVTAALEAIYQKLLDDDAFIGALNFAADFVGGIEQLIDSLGGLNGVLGMAASLLWSLFSDKIINKVQILSTSFMTLTKKGQESTRQMQQETNNLLGNIYGGQDTSMGRAASSAGEVNNTYLKVADKLKGVNAEIAQLLKTQHQSLVDQTAELHKQADLLTVKEAKAQTKARREAAASTILGKDKAKKKLKNPEDKEAADWVDKANDNTPIENGQKDPKKTYNWLDRQRTQLARQSSAISTASAYIDTSNQEMIMAQSEETDLVERKGALLSAKDKVSSITQGLSPKQQETLFGKEASSALNEYEKKIDSLIKKVERYQSLIQKKKAGGSFTKAEKQEVDAFKTELEEATQAFEKFQSIGDQSDIDVKNITAAQVAMGGNRETLEAATQATQELAEAQIHEGKAAGEAMQNAEKFSQTLTKMANTITRVEAIGHLTSQLTSMAFALQSTMSLFQTFGQIVSGEVDPVQGFISILMSLGMILPMITNLLNADNATLTGNAIARLFGMTVMQKEVDGKKKSIIVSSGKTAVTWLEKIAQDALNGSMLAGLGIIGLILIAIAALIAIIVVVVQAFMNQKSAAEQANEAYQNNTKTLEALNETLDEAKTKLDEVRQLLEQYQNVQDAFDGLVKGSSAWTDNLLQNNELIREILKLYPEMALMKDLMFTQSADGYTVLTNMGKHYIEAKQILATQEASLAVLYQDIITRESKIDLKHEQILEQIDAGTAGPKLVQHISGSSETATESYSIGGQTFVRDKFGPNSGVSESTLKAYEKRIKILVNEGFTFEQIEQYFKDNYKALANTEAVQALLQEAENHWDELQGPFNEEIQLRQELNLLLQEQAKIEAQNILSTQRGFNQLTQLQQRAAVQLVADQIVANKQLAKDIQQGTELGINQLLSYYNIQADTSGWVFDDNHYSEHELKNTEAGQALLRLYAESKGITNVDIGKMKFANGTITYEDGDEATEDISFSVSEMMADLGGGVLSSQLNEAQAIDTVTNPSASDLQLGAILGDFNHISRDVMEQLGAERIEGESGYRLTDQFTHNWLASQGYNLQGGEYIQDGQIYRDGQSTGQVLTDTQLQRYQDLEQSLHDYNWELAETNRLRAEAASAEALLANAAEQYGLDSNALKIYNDELANLPENANRSKEAIAKMAIANMRYTKGVESLNKALEKNLSSLRAWCNGGEMTTEVAETVSDVVSALTDVFGVEVDATFIKQNLEDIEALTRGGKDATEALERLEQKAAENYVENLNLESSYEEKFKNMLQYLTALEDKAGLNINPEVALNDQEFINTLNTLLATGAITAEEIEKAFGAIGWSPEFIEGKPIPQEDSQYISTYDVSSVGDEGGKLQSIQRIDTTKYIKTVALNGKATYTPRSTSNIQKPSSTSSSGGSKKSKKKAKDEIKPYRQINAVLDDLQRKYDQVSEAKDRAFGPDRLKYIEQEIELTKKLAEAEKIKYEESKQHANDAAATLQQYGITFDENGLINNYNEAHQKQLDIYNKAVDDFNNGRISESKFETIENAYEHFIEYLDKYEEFYGDMRDKQERFIELENQRLDLQLEKVTYNVEFNISLQDDALTLLDYYFENIEDNAYKAAEAIGFIGQQMDILEKKSKIYTQGITDVLKSADFTDEEAKAWLETGVVPEGKYLTEEQINTLREYRDELLSINQEARDKAIQSQEKVGESFEYWNSELDRNAEKLERVNSTLETYKNIVDLLGAENLGLSTDTVVQMNEVMVAGSIARAKQAKAELDANEAAAEKQRAHYEELKAKLGEDDPVTRAAFETLRNMEDQVASSEEELLSAWQDGLQAAVDALSANVDAVIADFEKAMTGIYGSFDALQTAYDQYSQTNERYVADYAKIYELSKLNRDIMKSIDETDNVAAKRELLELQEEINEKQESGVEMSQYELNELRARYDLKLAEMALEDAQNAKSQVRMRRDAEGNWGYVYTADQNAIDSAMQNYEDKMYAYQQLTQDYAKEIESQLIGLPQEFAEAMRAIATDVTLTEEERKIRMEETTEFYRSQYKYLLDELEKTNGNSKRFYDEDWQAYSEATGYKIIANKNWLETFNAFTDTDGAYDKFFQATETVVDKIGKEWGKYDTNIQSVFNAVGIDMDNFLTSDKLKAFQDKQTELVNKGTELGTAYTNGFSAVMTAAQTAASQYKTTIQPMITANENLIGQINTAIEAYEALLEAAGIEIPDPSKGTSDKADTGNSSGSGSGNVNKTGKNWDNQGYTIEEVKRAQKEILSMQDANGYWGAISQAEAEEQGYKTLSEVITELRKKDKEKQERAEWNAKMQYARHAREITVNTSIKGSGTGSYTIGPGDEIYIGLDENAIGSRRPYAIYKNQKKIGYLTEGQRRNINGQLGVAFDTGGYTGSWGSEGRMAMLHQKEIVLNASDTENFLSAIGIVRDIAKAIDLTALSQSTMRANLSAAVGNIGSQVLEQEVTIHAEFPNATNHSEIEEAFNTLLNRASQFANRKNK